ncbi:hypothetical protein [Polaromonas sp. YR568]|jgi:hypothetical protein|uniref:hypothetical protein n=1 Tax=Polaromonas sp. YR568 TaxID=1855301 RepID=UPI00313808A6
MVETLFWAGLGMALVWIGVEMVRAGDWWNRMRADQQDKLIGMPPMKNEEVSQAIKESARVRYGGWFAATPLLGLVGILVGIVFIVRALNFI